MNDHDALLRAIGEHPEEDTPRLMYADWLEENGEPERADFVRNQVALARFEPSDSARYPFVRKNVAYLRDFVPVWKSQLPRVKDIEWGDFNRGLIEEVQAATEEPIARCAEEIFAVPGVHILRITRLRQGQVLAQVPELVRLRTLRLVSARAFSSELRLLFASPHLHHLTVIDMHGNAANNAVAADIADGRFPDLAELWLGANQISDAGALALADSRHLTKLRFLDLRGNHIVENTTRNALRRRFGSALKM